MEFCSSPEKIIRNLWNWGIRLYFSRRLFDVPQKTWKAGFIRRRSLATGLLGGFRDCLFVRSFESSRVPNFSRFRDFTRSCILPAIFHRFTIVFLSYFYLIIREFVFSIYSKLYLWIDISSWIILLFTLSLLLFVWMSFETNIETSFKLYCKYLLFT